MSTDDLSRSGGSFLSLLATGAIAMVAVFGIGVLSVIAQKSMASSGRSALDAPPVFASADWSERSMGEIVIEAPFQFGRQPDITQPLQNVLSSSEVFQSEGISQSFSVVVSRVVFKPNVAPNVKDVVRGSIQNVAAAFGDSSPKFQSTSTRINGRTGETALYHHEGAGTDASGVHVDTTVVSEGPKLWKVVVAYTNDASAPDAERILKSLKIK